MGNCRADPNLSNCKRSKSDRTIDRSLHPPSSTRHTPPCILRESPPTGDRTQQHFSRLTKTGGLVTTENCVNDRDRCTPAGCWAIRTWTPAILPGSEARKLRISTRTSSSRATRPSPPAAPPSPPSTPHTCGGRAAQAGRRPRGGAQHGPQRRQQRRMDASGAERRGVFAQGAGTRGRGHQEQHTCEARLLGPLPGVVERGREDSVKRVLA